MYLPSFAPSRQRRVRPQRRVIALSAALIALYGASTLWSLQRAHDQALRAAGVGLESMVRSAETGTTRSLFEIDAMLIGIERIVAGVLPTTQLDSSALKTVLGQFNAKSQSVSDILILDVSGNEVNRANAIPDRTRNDRHRAFFTAHRPGAPATLFIGDTLFARRRDKGALGAGGSSRGAVVGGIPASATALLEAAARSQAGLVE